LLAAWIHPSGGARVVIDKVRSSLGIVAHLYSKMSIYI
jgi:hypothetical protein